MKKVDFLFHDLIFAFSSADKSKSTDVADFPDFMVSRGEGGGLEF